MRGTAGWAWFCAVLLVSAAPASATLFIEVYADSAGDDAFDMQSTGETSIHGTAGALGTNASASAGAGPAGTCDFAFDPPLAGCSYTGAHAAGEIRGDLGRLRAQAFVADSTDQLSAYAILTLTDVLTTQTAGPVSFNFFLDFGLGSDGETGLLFQASLDGDSQVFVEEPFETCLPIPGPCGFVVVNRTIDETVTFPFLDAGTQIELEVMLQAAVFDDGFVNAHQTAFIGVTGDVVSQNGYSYLGVPGVPTPGAPLLVLAGLTLVGTRARSKSRSTTRSTSALPSQEPSGIRR
jgi:hypothetical protein